MCPTIYDADTGGDFDIFSDAPIPTLLPLPPPPPCRLKRICNDMEIRCQIFGRRLNIRSIPKTQPPIFDLGEYHVSEDPLDLVISTIEALRPDHLSPRQQEGLKEWLEWWPRHVATPVANDRDVWTQADMNILIKCFLKMFFHEKLESEFVKNVRFSWFPNLVKVTGDMGQTSHRSRPDGSLFVQILIDPGDLQSHIKTYEQMGATCSVILHEMVHAYLFAFCCDRYHDRAGRCTRKGNVLLPLGSGHSLAWFHLACHIEVTMPRIAYNFCLNLGVLGSGYLREISNGGVPFFAPEWKRFFQICGWDGACQLFDRLTDQQATFLHALLSYDAEIVQVFADEGRQH